MITLPKQPIIVESDARKAVIEIEGLFPGYGVTLGNALRRVLLSSCEGAAVTSFRVEGVHHEFSTIPNILEDVIDISLNLKTLRFRVFSNEPQTLSLVKKGEGIVTASDIAKNPLVEIVNPEAHIATLTDKRAALDMKMVVEKGMGYSEVDQRRKEKLPIGTVALDANFSPVTLVNVEVENMMVEGRADYNRLRLHIETDGSLFPLDAYDQAIGILVDHFGNLRIEKEKTAQDASGKEREKQVNELVLSGISTRFLAILAKHRVKTFDDIGKLNLDKISRFKGLGDKAIQEIRKVAEQHGIDLK